jgi:hypothetical protein
MARTLTRATSLAANWWQTALAKKVLRRKRGKHRLSNFGCVAASFNQGEYRHCFGLALHDFSMKKLANPVLCIYLFHHDKAPGTQKATATGSGLSARGSGPLVERGRSSSKTTG